MADKKKIILLEDVLKDLLRWFKDSSGEFLIIGGIAVSLMTRPRTTQDIDVLSFLDESQWGSFLSEGRRFGFEPRIKDALLFARENRVLLLRHRKSTVNIDLSFGFLSFEAESMRRRTSRKMGSLRIPLPTPEDLIIMKMVAHRPQDMVDVKTILETYPKLDRKRIQKWVKEFSVVLENPAILSDLRKMMKK
ncbi:MAG TPA: hypothetical protein DD723_09800 [Candidatus Omnitrophica bacterium]|nr:MAG: hypothetical protein A2Z81_03575 [Omnitrophica WOR_2 bacterium GWA2_45_18]HBR15812.1 hypothetical protein [Candidatus Omnitrophota bacterium]